MSQFAFAIALLLLILGMNVKVRPEAVALATALCERAGGVDYIYNFSLGGYLATVRCKDGTEVKFTAKEPT